MPNYCCAYKCTHNSRNCVLKVFPKKPGRARLWEECVRRANWIRKPYHRLCICHFDPSQFSEHTPGRLRNVAIPTIFPSHNLPVHQNGSTEEGNATVSLATPPALPSATLDSVLNNTTAMPSEFSSAITGSNIPVNVGATEEGSDTISLASSSSCTVDFTLNNTAAKPSELSSAPPGSDIPVNVDNIVDDSIAEFLAEFVGDNFIEGSDELVLQSIFTLVKESSTVEKTRQQANDFVDGANVSPNDSMTGKELICNLQSQNEVTQCENSAFREEKDELTMKLKALQGKCEEVLKENFRVKKKNTELLSMLSKFNDDEKQALRGRKVIKWSKETVRKCLQVRFAVGKNGYNFLSKVGYPVVSYSSLCSRVQKMPLDCGLSNTLVALMKEKGRQMKPQERHCILTLDEMEIEPKLEHDLGRKVNVGFATLGDQKKLASKLLLLVARGLSTKWKQVIGWHLTTSIAAPPSDYWNFLLEGIMALENANYRVEGNANDMASNNCSLWSAAGIQVLSRKPKHKKGSGNSEPNNNLIEEEEVLEIIMLNDKEPPECEIVEEEPSLEIQTHCIPHPCRPGEYFYFFADYLHLLKNLKSGFLRYKINLSPEMIKKHKLPNAPISSEWLWKLIELQNKEGAVFEPVPFLTPELLTPDHHGKMRVNLATAIFSEKITAALETAVLKGKIPKEAETTIWFLKKVREWFSIVTARYIKKSITKKNYSQKKAIIDEFSEIIRGLKAADNRWKPFQRGIVMSNKSFLALTKNLLFTRGFRFFMGARTTQDCVESMFSQIRFKGNRKPCPLQALRAVRLLCFSQFSQDIKSSSYSHPNDKPFLDILRSPAKKLFRKRKATSTPRSSRSCKERRRTPQSVLPLTQSVSTKSAFATRSAIPSGPGVPSTSTQSPPKKCNKQLFSENTASKDDDDDVTFQEVAKSLNLRSDKFTVPLQPVQGEAGTGATKNPQTAAPYWPPDNDDDDLIFEEVAKAMNLDLDKPSETLQPMEEEAIADAAGYLVRKTRKHACQNCAYFQGHQHESILTACRDKGGLVYVTENVFILSKKLEILCHKQMQSLDSFSLKEVDSMIRMLTEDGQYKVLCNCLFFSKYSEKFIRSRLFFLLRKVNKQIKRAAKLKKKDNTSYATASTTLFG